MLRDAPGFAWYFTTYELFKRQLGVHDQSKETIDKSKKSGWQKNVSLLLAGGFAGQTTWLICYPADFLKTRLQTAKPGER